MTHQPVKQSEFAPSEDGHGLISSGVFLTAGALIQAAVGIGAQLILMRLLLPEEFGGFATILAGVSLAQIALSLRLNILIFRLPNVELIEDRRHLYEAALVWETVAAAAVALIWLAAAGFLSAYAVTLVAAIAIAQWTNQASAFFERTLAYRRIVAIETGSQILGHLVAVALVLTGVGALSLYIRELVVALARLGAFGWIRALPWPRCRWPRWSEVRALAVETRGLWVDGIMDNGFARVVVLTTAGIGGLHGAGIFTQSQRLAIIPHQILAPVAIRMSGNLFNRISDHAARRRLLARMMLATLTILSLVAGLTIAFADPVVPLVLGEHWRPAVDTIIAMTGVIVFFTGFELLRVYCTSQNRMRLVLAGRGLQYAIFLTGCALALGANDPLFVLATGLSAAYAGAFILIAAGLVFRRVARVLGGIAAPR